MIIKLLQILISLVLLYLIIGIGTIVKNGTSLFDQPGVIERLKTFLSTNVAETSENAAYPELRTRNYPSTKQVIIEKTIVAATQLGYTLNNQTDGELHFVATTALLKFKDDLYVSISENENGSTTVNAKSKSRKGRADFGANINNITRLFSQIENSL
jgi:uncharacterized protein (DUF1499 family)